MVSSPRTLFLSFALIETISFSMALFDFFSSSMLFSRPTMVSSRSFAFLPIKIFFRRFSVLKIQKKIIKIATPAKIRKINKKILSSFIFILFQYILFLWPNQTWVRRKNQEKYI